MSLITTVIAIKSTSHPEMENILFGIKITIEKL